MPIFPGLSTCLLPRLPPFPSSILKVCGHVWPYAVLDGFLFFTKKLCFISSILSVLWVCLLTFHFLSKPPPSTFGFSVRCRFLLHCITILCFFFGCSCWLTFLLLFILSFLFFLVTLTLYLGF